MHSDLSGSNTGLSARISFFLAQYFTSSAHALGSRHTISNLCLLQKPACLQPDLFSDQQPPEKTRNLHQQAKECTGWEAAAAASSSCAAMSLCLCVFMVLPEGTQGGDPTFDGHLQILPTQISCINKQVKLHLNYPLLQALASYLYFMWMTSTMQSCAFSKSLNS